MPRWRPELIDLENKAKQKADILFFVVDNQTRSVVSMIEVAYIAATQRHLLLVLHPYSGPGALIADEPISQAEYQDLNQAQSYLNDLVERQNFPVFDQIPVALNCLAATLRQQDIAGTFGNSKASISRK